MLGINGHAIGIGRLVDCRKMLLGDEDKCFFEYHQHLFCLIYEDCKRIVPFSYISGQKLINVSSENN